ncbi:hypothetical protein [Haladaptatus sp. NG-WS-4]
MHVTFDPDGQKEVTYEMDVPPRQNEIVRLRDDVFVVADVIWRPSDDGSGLEPVVDLHRSSL